MKTEYRKTPNSRATLGGKRRYEAYDMLKEAIIPSGENGVCSYKPGWSDEKIADKMKCSLYVIKNMRLNCFGVLKERQGGPKAYKNDILERLEAIEEYLTRNDPKWNK